MTIDINIHTGGYVEEENVIADIQFQVNSGELVGLIGSNGAGKSTTLQAMMGVLPIMDGQVSIGTYGYIPERPILYEYFTLWEHIDFYMRVAGKEASLTDRAQELLNIFKLDHKLHDYPTTFSKGMQQKVMLILAFLDNHSSYILDEPFMGLDPQAMRKLLTILDELKAQGAAILMSTHALDTAEKICDRFILIDRGRIIQQGTLTSLRLTMKQDKASLLDIFDTLLEENHHD
ncbi:ABC transporter ATP-binding protein [Lysinibacillus sp. G4S2]|uniref:ABC transporter ATP-binding protein n=1 Tax=Lysinibacillus sp. G4S2 TaxID=3055859 RepID=UPI0025A090A4|nr:ABC transporter ATP-binding protein [Lysinibacillus sp. G4S2]MDM5248969.1 ABC transporter ATP-binding protein [Lysinibacillus sp. G4S2]